MEISGALNDQKREGRRTVVNLLGRVVDVDIPVLPVGGSIGVVERVLCISFNIGHQMVYSK